MCVHQRYFFDFPDSFLFFIIIHFIHQCCYESQTLLTNYSIKITTVERHNNQFEIISSIVLIQSVSDIKMIHYYTYQLKQKNYIRKQRNVISGVCGRVFRIVDIETPNCVFKSYQGLRILCGIYQSYGKSSTQHLPEMHQSAGKIAI